MHHAASLTVTGVFIAATLLGAWLFLRAVPARRLAGTVLAGWMLVQLIVGLTGFYTVMQVLPPRFLYAIGPPLLTIVLLVGLPRGRAWMERVDLRALTLLHVVRIPVEWGLHQLYVEGLVPQVMTWEGRNLDVLSGLTAPLVAWLAFRGGHVHRPLLAGWNVAALALLGVIVFHGILSVPTPLQRFGFEQPNVALMYVPFNWLPSVIVPLVLLAHVIALYRLLRRRAAPRA
jgi:hypothetical protein